MDGLGVSENGLGSAPDLPALAIKAETNAGSPFRRGPRGEGDLVGKNAVSAAAAAVQQSLLWMEKVRTPPPPFPFYNVPPDIFSLRAPSQTTPIPSPRPLTFSPRAHLPPPRSQQAATEGKPPSSPPASAIKREPRLSEHATPPPSDPGSAVKRRKMSLGGASSAGMSTGGGTAEKDKDKGGKGLRHFSMKVCEKVESKQRTTYNEVADELVAEFSKPDDPRFCADQAYDEKNIRRRVYDALNVLMAMNIITKEKKEIMWKGLPATSESDVEHLREEKLRARARVEKKNAHLRELVEQYNSYQALLQRNAARAEAGVVPSGIQLPFILVQTRPSATVEVEISEDQQVVHFDFNGMPFQIHDGNFVLANMNLGMDSLNLGDDPTDGEVDISSEGLVRDAAEDAVANGKKDTNGNAIGVSGEGAPAGSAAKTKGRRSARGDGTNTGAKVVSRGARGVQSGKR